jgi:apolipoprotein N-acyltransferase
MGGVLMTLTLPPIFLLPLLIPAFCVLYWLIDAAPSSKRAFADGWWWGMGWHVTGLYWFCIALLTDPEKFAWLIPFTLIGLNAVIALYAGLACWLWKRIKVGGLTGILMFSLVWTIVEYARGHLFSGFPWNLAGYSFTASDALLQMASLVGVYGMTWFAVLLAVIPSALGDASMPKKRAFTTVAVGYVFLAVIFAWGGLRLSEADREEQSTAKEQSGIVLRLVQANIDQYQKWDPKLWMQGLEEHVKLTQSPGVENISIFIWPETAIPYTVKSGDALLTLIASAIPPRSYLITGALRSEGEDVYNSIMMIDHKGAIVGSYDKARLVPFGEFLPFRNLFPPSWLTPVGAKDFSRGPGPRVMQWPNIPPVLPLICYEVIFPEFLSGTDSRPDWLLNLTNDAWFGNSSGPHQHFHMARTRAVEEGVPLVRVANTGITGIVDAYGRVIIKMGHGYKGFMDISFPQAKTAKTLYKSLYEWIIRILILVAVVLKISQLCQKNN